MAVPVTRVPALPWIRPRERAEQHRAAGAAMTTLGPSTLGPSTQVEQPADLPTPVDQGGPPVAPARPRVAASDIALRLLAAVAVVFALDWAQELVISLLLGILFAYTLNPLVAWLEWLRVPRVLGAAVVLLGVVGALGLGSYSLRGQAERIVEQLPAATDKIEQVLASKPGNIAKVQTAARAIEQAANKATDGAVVARRRITHVVIDQPSSRLGSYLLTGSLGALGFLGQAVMVLFLVYFLLLTGDTFKRKLVRLSGPSLSNKKTTIHILDDINASIQKFMLMLFVTNALVGVLSWLAFRWIGLDNAGAWAVVAALLHVVPYLGPGLTAAVVAMAAFMQFDSFSVGLLAAGASLAIATLVGTFVTTWMTGRIAKMNTAAVFISLLFWGWLWGVWGMLLSIPIVVIVKVVAQHVDRLNPVAELLGE